MLLILVLASLALCAPAAAQCTTWVPDLYTPLQGPTLRAVVCPNGGALTQTVIDGCDEVFGDFQEEAANTESALNDLRLDTWDILEILCGNLNDGIVSQESYDQQVADLQESYAAAASNYLALHAGRVVQAEVAYQACLARKCGTASLGDLGPAGTQCTMHDFTVPELEVPGWESVLPNCENFTKECVADIDRNHRRMYLQAAQLWEQQFEAALFGFYLKFAKALDKIQACQSAGVMTCCDDFQVMIDEAIQTHSDILFFHEAFETQLAIDLVNFQDRARNEMTIACCER